MNAKTKLQSARQTVAATPMPGLLKLLTIVTLAGFCFTLVLGLVVAGTDIQQGEIQRIFYIHMPSFFGALTAFGLTVVGGILYLWRKSEQWDRIAGRAPKWVGFRADQSGDWLDLGAADLEYLVDLGSAPDLGRHHGADLRGIFDAARRH